MPRRGDQVRVTVEGIYSHQGDVNTGKSGFHVVTVPGEWAGRPDRQIALPPEAEFEVTKRYVPPEPAEGSWVCTGGGIAYRRSGNLWFMAGHPTATGRTWENLAGKHKELFWMANLGAVTAEPLPPFPTVDGVVHLGVSGPILPEFGRYLAKRFLVTFGDE